MNDQDQHDLFMNQLQQSINDIKYPYKIDVVDAVMSQLKDPKANSLKHRSFSTWKTIASIAACAAICLIINLSILYTRSYDDAQLGTMMAEVYNYNHIYGNEDNTLYASDEIMNYYIMQ